VGTGEPGAGVEAEAEGRRVSINRRDVPPETWAALTGESAPAGKPAKYRNEPTTVDGIRFDSRKEAARWCELRLLERAGAITDLERQVRFALEVGGVAVAVYVADFRYVEGGVRVVEDAKGMRTREYRLKKRLMLACHGITIRET
jgi:hypothetical protein